MASSSSLSLFHGLNYRPDSKMVFTRQTRTAPRRWQSNEIEETWMLDALWNRDTYLHWATLLLLGSSKREIASIFLEALLCLSSIASTLIFILSKYCQF